jgi:hypothetical protein
VLCDCVSTLDYLFVSTRPEGSHHDDSKAALEVSDARLIGSSSCLKLMQENCSEKSDPSLSLSDAPPSKSFTYDDLPDGPFPNEQWPSDHIMILADLLI